jgi:hypothetical protein
MRAITIVPGAVALMLAAAGPAFEPAPTFQASRILPADLLKGPHFTVSEEVKAEGVYQVFEIVSDFGNIEAEGRTVLRTRVREVGALARLSEVSKGEIFAKAAGGAVLNVGKGVASVVKDPEGTAKGIGGGLKRFGVNLGRKAKRTADSVTHDDKKAGESGESTGDKALDAAGGAANSVFGVNGAARKWAQKLGVDPYTTNPVLHKALVDVGKIDTAGSIATKIVLPVPVLVSSTATIGGLVWSKDPEELRKINEARLAEVGVSKAGASRYFVNGNYTLTMQTRLIAALHEVKVKGCADYVDTAADADDEREALFFVESAEWLAGMNKAEPVSALLSDSRAIVAKVGTRAVALLPVDWVRWTEEIQRVTSEFAARAKPELGATALEMRITGTATEAAKARLRSEGWTVKEHVPTT